MKRIFFFEIAYDGSEYHGWQRQNNAVSVQEKIEQQFTKILKKHDGIVGCGRTDTGVHASQYVFHVEINDDEKIDSLVFRLNTLLPDSIVVRKMWLMKDDAHARFSATKRSYQYFINPSSNPFNSKFEWNNSKRLDISLMQKGASNLLGDRDFSSFAKFNPDLNSHICQLSKCNVTELEDGRIMFELDANRFLRNMVRAIVGTLVEIGLGKRLPDEIDDILMKKDRSAAGTSAPAKGLFLSKIEYPKNLYVEEFI